MSGGDENRVDLAGDDAQALLRRAYGLDGLDSVRSLYRDWATTYDSHLEHGLGYTLPAEIARSFASRQRSRTPSIVDIGCGTGLTAQALVALGFATIDGIDISPEMLAQARCKGLYRRLIAADLTRSLDIASQAYHAAISSGTFTHGHVGARAFHEIFRILRPGALFVTSINSEVWVEGGFGPTLLELTRAGVMHVLEISPCAAFRAQPHTFRIAIFEKA